MNASATAAPPAVASDPTEVTKIEPCVLTPKQQSDWEQTMSLMSWTCPGFRHIFYKLLANNDGKYGAVMSRDVPIAATDAKNIIINPEPFFKLGLKERVFALGHEVVHNVYGDVEFLHRCQQTGTVPMDDGSTLPFRNSTMQKAMDFRINALLRDSNIGTPIQGILLDDTIATAKDSVIDAYKKVYDDEENNDGKKTGGKQSGWILAPGVSTGKQPQPRNQAQWQVAVQAAQTLEAMKSQGKGMGALKHMFDQVLEPVVPWTEHIRGIFNRKVGSGSFNWKRPNRRLIIHDIYAPSRSGNGAGWVVVWGDTSGSCIAEVNKFLPELTSIMEDCQPKRLTVVWCDDGVQRVDELKEPIDLAQVREDGAPGGGGTSVEPVFEWIEQNGNMETPEVFIAFTDGYVTFPDARPAIPNIIWAMTTDVEAPWGETVKLYPKGKN